MIPKFVLGEGQQSPLMLLGDYPTKEEQNAGKPFIGSCGSTVNDLLKKAGLSTNQLYKTYYVKTFIEGAASRSKKRSREAVESALLMADWNDLIKREIAELQPKVILALGELSLNAVTELKGIYKYRGSIVPLDPRLGKAWVVPTLHPRDIWENIQSLAYIPLDYQKAAHALRVDYQPENPLLWVCRTYNELANYWNRAQKGKFMVYDIETYKNFITCIGFCTDGHEAISVPLFHFSSAEEARMVYQFIAKMLAHKMPKVNQNIKFDNWMLNKWGFYTPSPAGDTMQLGHLLYPELPKNLGFYTSVYTNYPYHKDEGGDYNPDRLGDNLYIYNAKDTLVTWIIHEKMEEDAKELKVWNLYTEEIMPLVDIYTKSEKRGIQTDETRRQQLLTKYKTLAESHQSILDDISEFPVNVRSSKQVGSFVYEFLGCPPITHTTEAGKTVYSTDKEVIEDLYINKITNKKIRYALKEVILLRKILLLIDFLNRAIHPDGRVRTQVKIHGTKSGRTAGDSSIDQRYFLFTNKIGQVVMDYEELGYSLQTIPKRKFEMEGFEGLILGEDIPSMFVPSPGYVFVEGDGSQAEAREVCVLSEDYETLALMNKKDFKRNIYKIKDDIHTLTATWTTKKPFEEITEFDREKKGKQPRHAGNYDMGAYRLSMMIHLPMTECQEILNRFHSNAPKIQTVFHREIRNIIDNVRVLTTPHGRRRDFFDRRSAELYKEAFSYIPQAVISDHTKFSMRRIAAELPMVELILEKHDSLLYEVPIGLEHKFCEVFKRVYERPIDHRNCSLSRDIELVIPCELKVGKENWKDMEEVKL